MRLPIIFVSILLLGGCTSLLPEANRIDIQQGNLIDQEALDALQPGMTRAQVRELLGGPVLTSGFRPDLWDYIYYRTEAGREPAEVQHLSLYFEDERLVRIEGRYEPPEPRAPDDTRLPPADDVPETTPPATESGGGIPSPAPPG